MSEILANPKGGLRGPSHVKQFNYRELDGFQSSNAHRNWQFYYTDYNGWFFSPYQESMALSLAKGFGKFLEGSLFDWQFGDLMDTVAGCTAGDVRVRSVFHFA
jgi:hypothetical protein